MASILSFHFRPHEMHDMRTVAVDDPVRLSVTRVACAKTAERIDVLFGVGISVLVFNLSLQLYW